MENGAIPMVVGGFAKRGPPKKGTLLAPERPYWSLFGPIGIRGGPCWAIAIGAIGKNWRKRKENNTRNIDSSTRRYASSMLAPDMEEDT